MKVLFIPALFAGLLFSSCSDEPSGSETATLKPQSTKVSGALSHSYEVVDKEYMTTNDGYSSMLAVSIKRVSDDLPFVPNETSPYGVSSMGKDTHVGIGIELFDENGNSIETINASEGGSSGVYSHEDIVSIINLQKGETATVRWSIDDALVSKIKSFKITTAMEKSNDSEGTEGSDDSNEPESNVSQKGSGSVDKLLDSYEGYIDKYIVFMKKASKNDMSAMEEYPKLMEKAQKLGTELDKNQGDMSSAQMQRFLALQTKFTKAMSQL